MGNPFINELLIGTGSEGAPQLLPRARAGSGCSAETPAGFPNGRRLFDDVTDVFLRVVAGGIFKPSFNVVPNNRVGDGVNINGGPYRSSFPYLSDRPSGRDRRHIDPGEAGCTAGAPCPL